MKSIDQKKMLGCAGFLLLLCANAALAGDYTGNVNMLETWFNGNVAFTLTSAVPTCNSQFILNVSSAGSKVQYAVVLAAKAKSVQIRVVTNGCGAADGSAGSYNAVSYIYMLDT